MFRNARSLSAPARPARRKHRAGLLAASLLLVGLCAGIVLIAASRLTALAAPSSVAALSGEAKLTEDEYVVLAWNDLGMHCYNGDFDDLAVLPPWNTLWAQVVKIGEPPQVITEGLTVEFLFEHNTTSVDKSNFWEIGPSGQQNAQWLFDLPIPLPDNIGLTGAGLSGIMEVHGDHFSAEGIPLTEFEDGETTPEPYQLATVIVRHAGTGEELARTQPVAPVSTEMHCDNCHDDNGPGNPDIATGVVEQNVLTLHDQRHRQHPNPDLMERRPVLCADCHASNALGKEGDPRYPSLSNAMHGMHTGEVPDSLEGCYNCHPGPETQCLRDVMASDESPEEALDCVDCHGGMGTVSLNSSPWLNEPTCADTGCHDDGLHEQDHDLYRLSKGHGGVYCAGCHDSPHAIAPSREPADAIKFIGWQGYAGNLDNCIVCHSTLPDEAGPHGELAGELPFFALAPDGIGSGAPATELVYTHTITNAGNVADLYQLSWASTQEWAAVTSDPVPLDLSPGASGTVTVTITIPEGGVEGLTDRTVVTATSSVNTRLFASVVDKTSVPVWRIYLPLVLRGF